MAIHYKCRYCGTNVGTIEQNNVAYQNLGFHKLTAEERAEMISFDSSGNVHVKCICDDCQESFLKNPANYETDYIIH